MSRRTHSFSSAASAAIGFAIAVCAATTAHAQATAAKPPPRPAARTAKTPPPPPQLIVPDAQPEQMKAADMVYYGHYECEFDLSVDIAQSAKHPAYVDVRHGKGAWLMRPVLSTTGAIRLEDVKDETLMVQIASKSMLLNVKTGRRIVDDCISPKQRELIEAAKVEKAKAAAEAEAAKAAASAPAPASAASS